MSFEDQMDEIRAVLADTVMTLQKASEQIKVHAELIAQHDERMDRIERHLEVLVQVADGLIRDGGKRRKK